jgi:hypothetical protein
MALSVFAAALTVTAGSALASWQPAGSGVGSARSKNMSASVGAKPTATPSVHNVTVSWAASTFLEGGAVPSYIVKRYDLLGNPQSVGAACSGLVSGTSCIESGVPTNTWKYTVTPAIGTWWIGVEGPQSDPVIVTGL